MKKIPIVLASELVKTMTGKCWFTWNMAIKLHHQGKIKIVNDLSEHEAQSGRKHNRGRQSNSWRAVHRR